MPLKIRSLLLLTNQVLRVSFNHLKTHDGNGIREHNQMNWYFLILYFVTFSFFQVLIRFVFFTSLQEIMDKNSKGRSILHHLRHPCVKNALLRHRSWNLLVIQLLVFSFGLITFLTFKHGPNIDYINSITIIL